MERTEPSGGRRRSRFTVLEGSSLLIASLSLLVAGLSASFSYRLWSDRERNVVIEDIYEGFEEWNAELLDRPLLLHLATPPGRYPEVAGQVELAARELSRQEILELALAESVMADLIFDTYEELLDDLGRATEFGDPLRGDVIERAVGELEHGMLCNPRLLHLWSVHSQEHRPDQVLARYEERVSSRSPRAADDLGPIGRALATVD